MVDRYLSQAVISTVNLTEVASYMIRNGMAIDEVSGLLTGLALTIVAYDTQQALIAAGLVPVTASRGLSLGDRACLALALQQNLPVLTADRAWQKLDVGVNIELIR